MQMFLIPYLYIKKEGTYITHIFHIFLNKGILYIQVDADDIDNFLVDNGFFYNNKHIDGDICYVEVDPIKTHLNSFYSYIDNDDAECWRRFIYIEDDVLHINTTNPEFIQPVLDKLLKSM